MKKLLATACVLMASTVILGACVNNDVDTGRGLANDTAGGSTAVERTFSRSQSK